MGQERVRSLGWWSISGEALMEVLARCRAGEDPGVVYAQAYANCRVERVDPADG